MELYLECRRDVPLNLVYHRSLLSKELDNVELFSGISAVSNAFRALGGRSCKTLPYEDVLLAIVSAADVVLGSLRFSHVDLRLSWIQFAAWLHTAIFLYSKSIHS